jgi:hypothetical protein
MTKHSDASARVPLAHVLAKKLRLSTDRDAIAATIRAIDAAAREGRYFSAMELGRVRQLRCELVSAVPTEMPDLRMLIDEPGGARRLLERLMSERGVATGIQVLRDLIEALALVDLILQHGPGADGLAAARLEAALFRQLDNQRRRSAKVSALLESEKRAGDSRVAKGPRASVRPRAASEISKRNQDRTRTQDVEGRTDGQGAFRHTAARDPGLYPGARGRRRALVRCKWSSVNSLVIGSNP